MREFRDCTWNEGAEALTAMLPRLTVLRDILNDKPVKELLRCASALIAGDIRCAADACFEMTSALLTGGYRRISGNLFKDYLLHTLLVREHPFALMAAQNRLDEAIYNSMRQDIGILYELMELDAEHLYRFVQDRYRELRQRSRQNKDNASQLASAAWGGGEVRRSPKDDFNTPYNLPAFMPDAAPVWHYGDEELRDAFAADEALEEMYHRLLESGMDRSAMTEDLWNFFASYGTGVFLKSRCFLWDDNCLTPMTELRQAITAPLLEREYNALLRLAIDFMRGDGAEPILLFGERGMGKTTMLLTVAEELPEIRFVYASSINGFAALVKRLSAQPLKFLVALDDEAITTLHFATRTLPVNVLPVVLTSKDPTAFGGFTRRIAVLPPRMEGFITMVQTILDSWGAACDAEVVRAACAEAQINGSMTVAAAAAIAERLKG